MALVVNQDSLLGRFVDIRRLVPPEYEAAIRQRGRNRYHQHTKKYKEAEHGQAILHGEGQVTNVPGIPSAGCHTGLSWLIHSRPNSSVTSIIDSSVQRQLAIGSC